MMEPRIISTAGLVLTILGCVLLYNFGLPAAVDPSGNINLILEQRNEAEIAKGKLYRKRGRFGIALIAVGSALQIGATWA